MRRRGTVHSTDADELEDHLRSTITELTGLGLRPDEAFLVAVKRLGSVDELAREFAREHSGRLWKQLVLTDDPATPRARGARSELRTMIACAAAAAIAIKAPTLFGASFDDDFYARNLALFAFTPLAAYFAIGRRLRPITVALLALWFVLGAVGANAYPLREDSQSIVLTAIHLPIALWLMTGVAYAGGDWRSQRKRMDFIRFTGEWFVYFVLIALGGGVLIGFTVGTFDAIGIDAEEAVSNWLLPCGGTAAVVVAARLVEAKQNVIENIAPVLTKIFTPLFTAVLLALLIGIGLSSTGIDVRREVLILFDLLLAVVLALLLYSLSARDPLAEPGWFDRLQLALVVSALLVDILVLVAITGRITEWGSTPNKLAALGENLILLTNLAWSAWLLFAFLRRRLPFARLDRWQTNYVVVYAVWAWIVVLAFPPLFGFE
ncbi:permease prefix domain 1-containing protein [Nocardia sp. CDC159]|uniref:Permease prefix domain 1-containing protein n=1 Tax=Nocardia pulmonis TaxID=2951408 RepID=A0A9X2E8C0_9NOCA|nr:MULTISPECIES: permease prefix domain 1-containing protein [Nocardia]MCM6774750.1 permease prefix domain 1-containing protein [Nocardia pulmonis]MCM6787185.1 permease prefix domain 1-containing protein [Nocardia sp. CDC159]